MPDGRIEARQVKRLKEIGAWIKINGEAIYNTMGGPYQPDSNYASTRKGNRIYLHVINTNKKLISLKNIPGYRIIASHTFDGEKVSVDNGPTMYNVLLPADHAGKAAYVIVLEFSGNVETVPVID